MNEGRLKETESRYREKEKDRLGVVLSRCTNRKRAHKADWNEGTEEEVGDRGGGERG